MNIYEAIYSRRTVRNFLDKDIDSNIVKKILAAGLQAPSNDHMRNWEFIVINDKQVRLTVIDKVNKYSRKNAIDIIDQWNLTDNYQREMYLDGIPKQFQMLLSAGCLIIPLFRQKHPLLQPENLSALNGFASIWCCIENMLLSAASEGIQGVTRIPFDQEIIHIKEVLNIPKDYEVPCYLAIGYPCEKAKSFAPHPIKVEDRIHINAW